MATYGTGPVGYKKFCDERIDFIETLRQEKFERRKLLGKIIYTKWNNINMF